MHQWRKLTALCLLILCFVVVLIKVGNLPMKNNEEIIHVWGWQYPPYSADPIEYDDIVHHIVFTSVLGTLVSSYKVGSITPQIAETWTHSSDYKQWSFRIKESCFFENGDPITPKTVAWSLKRIALLQKRSESRSGITEHIEEVSKLKSMADEISGISFDERSVHLRFEIPKKDLLNSIGFGIYSIVHPSQYDTAGVWKNPKEVISSGPYRIEDWENEKLSLVLNERQKSCYQRHPKPIQKVEMVFGIKNIETENQEIISGSSKSLMINSNFEFLGPAESDILYIRLYNTQSKNSRLSDVKVRRTLRDIITLELTNMREINFSINRSFLPLTINGVSSGESLASQIDTKLLKGIRLKIPKYQISPKSEKHTNTLTFTEAFQSVMGILKTKYGMEIEESDLDSTSFLDIEKRSQLYDLELLLTGVIVESPYDDVRFMFESKEGIRLPDTNGDIKPLLANTKDNIGRINYKIWEQANIIPITHYSSGLWVKSGVFDTSQLNNTLPATNFQFFGLR